MDISTAFGKLEMGRPCKQKGEDSWRNTARGTPVQAQPKSAAVQAALQQNTKQMQM
jgi:hypothetical protein